MDLVRAGKVRAIGHSTFPASAIVEAQWTAELRDRERFRCEQPPYSILTRGVEAEVLPTCARYGMGVIPYSPLAGGWLSGRYRKDAEVQGPVSPARQRLASRFDLSLPENQRKLDAAEQLAALADKAGLTLIQLAIAFVLRHPAVTAAIIGPRTMEHLESQLAAAGVELPDDVLDRIDETDRSAGHHHQSRRRRLGQPGPGTSRATPLALTGRPAERQRAGAYRVARAAGKPRSAAITAAESGAVSSASRAQPSSPIAS
jgi:aryl-alcohol dehydrogenase-like predicted oxidoreductase